MHTFNFHSRNEDASPKEAVCTETPSSVEINPSSSAWAVKLWTNEQMLAALKAVEDGQPVNQAARNHGIRKTTLKDHLGGRLTHGTNHGPTPYLNTVEDELGNFLESCAH